MESLLRRDWATASWNGRGETRWRTPKTWRGGDWRWTRGAALDLLVDERAHGVLTGVWTVVRQIDDRSYDWLRGEADGGAWAGDLPKKYVRCIVANMQQAGQDVGGPMWIAAERAALRAAARVKDRVEGVGWTRPYGPRDVVTTIRLPFGTWRERPLRDAGDRVHYGDDELLGWFEARSAPRRKDADRDAPRPEDCAYAECALLSGGWAIRFVAVRPAGERRTEARAPDGLSPPPY